MRRSEGIAWQHGWTVVRALRELAHALRSTFTTVAILSPSLAIPPELDGGAMVEYFDPLMQYLKEQNQGRKCGW